MKKMNLLLLFIAFVFPVQLLADHLPDDQIAEGKAEHKLCGVNVYETTIGQVLKTNGRASTVEVITDKQDDQYPPGSGDRTYIWNWLSLKMRIGTVYYTDKKTKKVIVSKAYAVDVWGKKPRSEIGITGQGLALGDRLSKIEALYGKKYDKQKITKDEHTFVLIQWKDGTQLSIDFDKNEKISHMQLIAEVE